MHYITGKSRFRQFYARCKPDILVDIDNMIRMYGNIIHDMAFQTFLNECL